MPKYENSSDVASLCLEVRPTRFELVASAMSMQRSNQLS